MRLNMEASQNEMHSRLDPSNNLPFLETPSLSGEPSEVGLQGTDTSKRRPGLKVLSSEHEMNREPMKSLCVHESLVFSAELYSSKKICQNLITRLCSEIGPFQVGKLR